MAVKPISIDAYPTTYRRPGVSYHAISVANGWRLYRESCVVCHGVVGYGDGPAAEDLRPKPADLTARHANDHTAGDLYWWLSYGVRQTAMPGFVDSYTEEERWDLVNFLRALSSAERARSLAPVIDEPWLVAPDFVYGSNLGETKSLKDHRGNRIILLVLFVSNSGRRLAQLDAAYAFLRDMEVEVIAVPHEMAGIERKLSKLRLSLPVVTEGSEEIFSSYSLFGRSFAEEKSDAQPQHMEVLVDKQGYIRARWLPAEGGAWERVDDLIAQIELLRKEKARAPAPEEHVH
jgi:putative copper resistance protein D